MLWFSVYGSRSTYVKNHLTTLHTLVSSPCAFPTQIVKCPKALRGLKCLKGSWAAQRASWAPPEALKGLKGSWAA